MTEDQREKLRKGFATALRVAEAGGLIHVTNDYDRLRDTDRTLPYFAVFVGVRWPTGTSSNTTPEEFAPAKSLALNVLLGEPDTVIANALADMLLDAGHEYATAIAEKAAREERLRIAERLYGEAGHVLSRGPDPNDTYEFTAAALSSVADDLVMGVPPTAPKPLE